MGFNKRKWWHLKNNRSISIEICGWRSHPSIYIRVDGDERDICFHFALGIGIWISFERFLPKSWYPTYESEYGNGTLPTEKEMSLAFHGGCFWWNFWVSEEWSSWTKNKTWRKGNIDFNKLLKGKHSVKWVELERQQTLLPFIEGNYNVEIIKNQRIDSWAHWFTKRTISFDIQVGYYNKEGNFINKGIPVEGKGENSWDCDEDATYSMYFPGKPYRKDLETCFDAALYFWRSMMKNRERRGSAKWVPKEFKDKKLQIIE